jgi:hypothetical protein
MFDEAKAREIAEAALPYDDVTLGPARELREGWLFPWVAQLGCRGVIANKKTGRIFQLGSAFPIERDLELYDRGYQFERYDLVVTAIADLAKTRRALGSLGLRLNDLQIWNRLDELPCVFPAVSLYSQLEVLDEARREGWFEFEAREYRGDTTTG